MIDAQLQSWQEQGYSVLLQNSIDGWTLVLDTEPIGPMPNPHAGTRREMLRYVSPPCKTPEQAVQAALGRLRPVRAGSPEINKE